MNEFDIKINIPDLSDYSASVYNFSDKKTLLLMIRSFSKYVMRIYLETIEKSINSKRYKGNWEPIEDQGYLEYIGVIPKRDILSLIKDALELNKVGKNFIIRISPYYTYPETKIPLVVVLRAIENGTSKFSARPLVSKEVRKIRRLILDLWKGYLATDIEEES